jgi:hypothetical protein
LEKEPKEVSWAWPKTKIAKNEKACVPTTNNNNINNTTTNTKKTYGNRQQ